MKRDYPTINVIETGRHLKSLMMDRGLTVRDIQVFLKLASPQGVYHWFEGKSMPSLDHIYSLSELFQPLFNERISAALSMKVVSNKYLLKNEG